MAYNFYEIVNNGLGSNAKCWQYLTTNYNSLKKCCQTQLRA